MTSVLIIFLLSALPFLIIVSTENYYYYFVSAENQSTSTYNLNQIFELTKNSIVQITNSIPPTNILDPNIENQTALGSGFIYSHDGYIITNNHVVADTKIVDITFINGDRYTAKVIGTDFHSDLAVLKIIENITNMPTPLKIGNSSQIRVGDQVVAIGNPFGLEGSMTTGIISQIGRLLSLPEHGFSIPGGIQTDALINPGNSGGPLLNMKGEVIGVNTAGIFSSGIGIAIPSKTIERVIPKLIAGGNYSHPWLGLTGATITSDIAVRENLNRNFNGIIVDSIVKGSPADKAGINGSITDQYKIKHGGDIIIAIDGIILKKIDDLISYLDFNKNVGDNITLSIFKKNTTTEKQVTLESRPYTLDSQNTTERK